jgi:hypothetical protein
MKSASRHDGKYVRGCARPGLAWASMRALRRRTACYRQRPLLTLVIIVVVYCLKVMTRSLSARRGLWISSGLSYSQVNLLTRFLSLSLSLSLSHLRLPVSPRPLSLPPPRGPRFLAPTRFSCDNSDNSDNSANAPRKLTIPSPSSHLSLYNYCYDTSCYKYTLIYTLYSASLFTDIKHLYSLYIQNSYSSPSRFLLQ